MMVRLWIKPCFGYSATKGGKVGERHRWSAGSWGKGYCIWCHRYLEDLQYRPEIKPVAGSDQHLAEALRSSQ